MGGDRVGCEIGQILHRVTTGNRSVAEIVKGAHMLRIDFLKDLNNLPADEITMVLIGQRQRCSLKHLCDFTQVRHDKLLLLRKRILLVPAAGGNA